MERTLAADAERTGRPHRWGAATSEEMSLVDCVNAADAAVSDVSGAASDWLYSGKPFALTDVHGAGERFEAELPLARAAYRVEADATNIAAVVEDLLETDTRAPRRTRSAPITSETSPERCVSAFLDAARDCYRPAPTPAEEPMSGPAHPSPIQGERPWTNEYIEGSTPTNSG
ncbi:hypothetical protein GCM10029992_03640 [Glycomyces albus]